MTSIKDLVVFKKLNVHRLIVEPKRVKATYTLIKSDNSEVSKELIYSYDHKYFDKQKASDINLVSMMVAQVALNYGLFCEIIEFEGIFDVNDKRFILDMMENTSREIYVNKFLHKNEFLKPEFANLQPEKLEKYTAAQVIFSSDQYLNYRLTKTRTETLSNHYAILSSGGKDSLLTYGIIKEIGVPHPIFINESGRHWFTAINAYKYQKQLDDNTVKPWCNSDRIFNWMVRQMPFIKENFQNIRADIYPIRLWTVSVFLFGVLPIARKRKVGNILIGNEYDTTIKENFKGITHYQALYDQSKYFDNALTRYYQKKGWGIHQFSILRSLSELLIIKILVKRYPELQEQQVSCHAAHEMNGRMLPCGKCEKCRRIVGMLIALNEDPKRCGYTDHQIQNALKALSEKSVKQIGSDAAHLYFLLLSRGNLLINEHTKKLAKEHPQIMKLRFDKERSTLEDLPIYVRRPLLNIVNQYSEGICRYNEKKWQNIEYTSLPLDIPYIIKKQSHDDD